MLQRDKGSGEGNEDQSKDAIFTQWYIHPFKERYCLGGTFYWLEIKTLIYSTLDIRNNSTKLYKQESVFAYQNPICCYV